MEAIVNAKKLKEQVGALQGILAKKSAIPVLSRIKIEAGDKGDLIMTATDLDVSLIIQQEVDILQSGSICLSGKKLGDIAGTLPDEPVHLKLDKKGEKVEFRAGRFLSRLAGMDSDLFPEVARIKGEWVKIPASILYEGLRRTSFAVIDDQKRFTINGILLQIENGELKMVSTDGHRLCFFRMMLNVGNDLNLDCLIPIKAVRELTKILLDEIRVDSQTEIKIKKGSQLEFEIGNKTMTAREITGKFPNWEMVIPRDFESFAEINAKEFAQALTRVGVLADDMHRRVELVFYSDKVQLKAESPETGFSTEEVSCVFRRLDQSVDEKVVAESGWKIAFNTKYLMDFFSVCNAKRDEQRIIWKFGISGSQTMLHFEGENQLFSYVLVPLKV